MVRSVSRLQADCSKCITRRHSKVASEHIPTFCVLFLCSSHLVGHGFLEHNLQGEGVEGLKLSISILQSPCMCGAHSCERIEASVSRRIRTTRSQIECRKRKCVLFACCLCTALIWLTQIFGLQSVGLGVQLSWVCMCVVEGLTLKIGPSPFICGALSCDRIEPSASRGYSRCAFGG